MAWKASECVGWRSRVCQTVVIWRTVPTEAIALQQGVMAMASAGIPDPQANGWRRIGRLAVVRIGVGTLIVGGAVAIVEVGVRQLRGIVPFDLYLITYLIGGVLAAFLSYRVFVALVERRRPSELTGPGALVELGAVFSSASVCWR